MESRTCWLHLAVGRRPPQTWISRSASVDLPWSMCATMEKLRSRAFLQYRRRSPLRCCGPQWQPGSFGFSYLKHELSSLNGGGEKLIVAKQLVPVGRLAAPVNSQIV
jgi:hypothetical protein